MENIIKKSFIGIITVCITVIDIIDEVTFQLFRRILKLTRERINQSVIEVNRNVSTNVSNVSEHLIKCILYHAIHVREPIHAIAVQELQQPDINHHIDLRIYNNINKRVIASDVTFISGFGTCTKLEPPIKFSRIEFDISEKSFKPKVRLYLTKIDTAYNNYIETHVSKEKNMLCNVEYA